MKNYISNSIILYTIYLWVTTNFSIIKLRVVPLKENIDICIHTNIYIYIYIYIYECMYMFWIYFNWFITLIIWTPNNFFLLYYCFIWYYNYDDFWNNVEQLLTQNLLIFTINKENSKALYFPFLNSYLLYVQ